jgi:hypothetical protein
MADDLLNGREATGWELAAVARARQCERDRDLELLAGLLAEYPRSEPPVARPVARPVTTLAELP